MTARLNAMQDTLDFMTRRWWFFVTLALLQMVPPVVSPALTATVGRGYQAIFPIMDRALWLNGFWKAAYPFFNAVPMLLILGVIVLKNKVARFFSAYVALNYILFAILQNVAITRHGIGIVTVNLIMFLMVAAAWAWEAIVGQNDFTAASASTGRYFFLIPLAFLAFWYPLNFATGKPDFDPLYLITGSGGSGLAFCLMTPVYLSVLAAYHPNVNLVTMRVTATIGVVLGLYNMFSNFAIDPQVTWWNGILHIPLLVISIYALALSLRKSAAKSVALHEAA